MLMQYSLMLYFSNYANYRIGTYIDMLGDITGNSYMTDSGIPPHITIAMWNSKNNFKDEIAKLADETKAFSVVFESLGIFNSEGEKPHIFLAPVMNKKLIDFKKSFYDRIKLGEGDEFHKTYQSDETWVPHVTVGYNIEPENLVKAVERCASIMLPQKSVVTKIALAHCCPFTEIGVFELGGETTDCT